MMQGDACNLAFSIRNNAGNPVTPEDILDLEILLGPLRKTYGNRELFFQDGLWFFPLTQQETLGFWPAPAVCQLRLKWVNQVVEGRDIPGVRIRESISKEVL